MFLPMLVIHRYHNTIHNKLNFIVNFVIAMGTCINMGKTGYTFFK